MLKSLRNIAILITLIFISNSMVIIALPEQGEVGNIAPRIDLSVTPKKKPVDIVILTDYTGTKLSSLNTQINALKANFTTVNVDPVFHIVSSVKKVGTQQDELYMYRRYGRFIYTVSSYDYYKDYGHEEGYAPYTIEQKEIWEEAQGLYSSPESLPKRQPQNVGFTKSSLIVDEGRPNETDKLRKYYNVTIRCTNDVKSSFLFEEEIYYKNYARAIEYVYGSIQEEKAIIDSAWTREEKIGNVTYDVLSLDFGKLNALPLRAASDRHMIFLSDSYSKNYGTSLGNYFSFGDMTDTLVNYIEANNFSLYGVVPDEAKDMTLKPDKVSKIFPLGNTSLFYMKNGTILKLGDPAMAATLLNGQKMYPKAASDITGVKEVIQPNGGRIYLLMNNGTIKYVPSGTNTLATLSGVSGITKVFYNNSSLYIYAVNSNGKVFKINDDVAYPLNNPFVCDKVLLVGYEEILLTTDGTPYMQYSIDDKQRDTTTYAFTQVRIRDRNTDALSYLGPIKDTKSLYSFNGLYPIAVHLSSGVVRQFVGFTGNREDTTRYTYWYPEIWYDSSYKIDTSGVDRIENAGVSIFIYYKNGNVKMLAADYILHHDREEGDWYETKFRNSLVNVPVTNVQKTIEAYPNKYFITDNNNNTYMYDASSLSPNPVMGTTLKNIGNNIKGVYNCRMYYTNSKLYILKTNGGVRELTYNGNSLSSDKILPYTNIENIYASNSNAYLVDKDGYVYGTGNTQYGQLGYKSTAQYINTYVNPLPTTITIADNTKTYLSLLDLFKNIASNSEFFGTGQYAAAFNKIYSNYRNSGDGNTYVVLGDDLEYHSTYADYESDPEHSRQYRISHNPNYFDNSMGLSAYHNPAGFTTTPPVKLDKVGIYTINLKARDNPKADERFANYRLWSVGDQNLTVYVHRKPIAMQNITIDANGNGTYTVMAYDAGSYDLDHSTTRPDKGIVDREWRWKDSLDMSWHYERMNKPDCSPDRDYTLQLRVRDAEGAWSDYNTVEIADNPPIAFFEIEKNPIFANEKLLLTDKSFPQSFYPIDRWHWLVRRYGDDGNLEPEPIWDKQCGTSNDGTDAMEGYDINVKTDYADVGAGKYRIFLRVRDSRGVWSEDDYIKDLIVQESFKMSDFRVVKIRDLHLESYYYNPSTGSYVDKPMGVNEMAIDNRNFNGFVNGLTKGYLFEFEIDTLNFNEDTDTIEIIPRFYTCDAHVRDPEERDLYWENSRHEILKAGEGGHEAWERIVLTDRNRKIKEGENATWRGSYLIPGTSWSVPMGTPASDAKASRLHRDIIVGFEIKGYRNGELKYDYNLQKWPMERTTEKEPYEVGDVIRYSHTKNNLDDIDVILNRP